MQHVDIPSYYNVLRYETIGSTNAEAARLAASGEDAAPDGTLVWSLEQTDGRGRRGRHWNSPVGNLYTSILLRPKVPLRQAAQLGFVAALAVHDALRALGPDRCQVHCKWPNDVLVNHKKTSGILLESHGGDAESAPDWVVLGMGLNLMSHPEGQEPSATSILHEGFSCTLEQVLAAYTGYFLKWKDQWLSQGFAPIRAGWQSCCKGRGDMIEVRLENQTLEGVFDDIDDEGVLLLNHDGHVRRISAGDVFFPHVATVS